MRARRFQPVLVTEPTVEDTIAILRGLKEKYEIHHGVRITGSRHVGGGRAVEPLHLRPLPSRQGPSTSPDGAASCSSASRSTRCPRKMGSRRASAHPDARSRQALMRGGSDQASQNRLKHAATRSPRLRRISTSTRPGGRTGKKGAIEHVQNLRATSRARAAKEKGARHPQW